MNNINLSNSHTKKIRESFRNYIEKNYPTLKDKNIVVSDAFYPLRHDIGIGFWDIFKNENSIKRCQILLEQHLEQKKRLKPKSDASTYIGSIKKLKEHIDISYGGVQGLMNDTVSHDNIKTVKRNIKNLDKINPEIPKPSFKEVDYYLDKWNTFETYKMRESALDNLFLKTYPVNTSIDDVLIKVSVLNDFYNTNIFNPYKVATHIVNLNIDKRLYAGDASLVGDIARVDIDNQGINPFYSFASKYCNHHVPHEFPIYDITIARMLRHFKKIDKFFVFNKNDLKSYPVFKKILKEFQMHYDLTQYSLKEIEKYLWQLGKEHFSHKNY